MAYRNYSTGNGFIVDQSGNGDFTTISLALAAATSGDTIFIRPGTFTENPTLVAGVNLTAFGSDASLNGSGSVIINGTCTFTTTGAVTISSIQLQTNSAALLDVSGIGISTLNLINCYLNCSNNTGITFSSSSGSSEINLESCYGDIGTTGISLFNMTSVGNMRFRYCVFTNSGVSTTASTISNGNILLDRCAFNNGFSTSSTAVMVSILCSIDCHILNTTVFTTSGTGSINIFNGVYLSGTASAISIGTGTTVNVFGAIINSTNTNAITGAGTGVIANVVYVGTSHQTNVTTQAGGAINGLTQGSAPSAGFLGEQIRSFIPQGSAISLTNATPANLTSISLTSGIWDVSVVAITPAQICTGTVFIAAISTTSNTLSTIGDSQSAGAAPTATTLGAVSISSYRITLASTTTIYLVLQANFTVGTCSGFGRISATRVG